MQGHFALFGKHSGWKRIRKTEGERTLKGRVKKGKGKRVRRAWNESEQGKTQSKIGEVE